MAPISSRHRAVCELGVKKRLYNFSKGDSGSLNDIIVSSIIALPIAEDIACITTSERHLHQEDTRLAELKIYFWGLSVSPIFSSFITMPSTWTPNMYLSALYLSTMQHSIIVVDRVFMTSTNKKYVSINEIHKLFYRDHDVTERLKLQLAPGCCHVRGGFEL